MPFRINAGPMLSESAFYCATFGAYSAIAATDLINAAHWKAAERRRVGLSLTECRRPSLPILEKAAKERQLVPTFLCE